MEIWKVLAVDKKATLKIREENKIYLGLRYLLQAPVSDPKEPDRWVKFQWREQFISNERLTNLGVIPCPGDTIKLFFDRFGSIDEIIVVEKDAAYWPTDNSAASVKEGK